MQDVLKQTINIAEAVKLCLGKKIHFVVFRLPGENSTTLLIQKNPVVEVADKLSSRLPEKGFIIAPFSRDNNKTFVIKPDIVVHDYSDSSVFDMLKSLPEREPVFPMHHMPVDTEKSDYIRLIRESIGKIRTGEFEKVVLSRIRSVKGNFRSQLPSIFGTLCQTYPNAFVYLFSVEDQCWTGATPEPFILSDSNEFRTVSLAGTRTYKEKDLDIRNWNRKEMQEQEYVTLHIDKILKSFNITGVHKSGPFVARAGNLLHLRTDFTFPADSLGNRLPSLIASLHPTPAVCGMSTGKAMDFIKNAERHNREYYAGFLGPVGFKDVLRLYVNLRCMKVFDDRLVLFIGGGITRDSVPEEEWEETEMKADTLLSVLNKRR